MVSIALIVVVLRDGGVLSYMLTRYIYTYLGTYIYALSSNYMYIYVGYMYVFSFNYYLIICS